jgi:hypothetical protein
MFELGIGRHGMELMPIEGVRPTQTQQSLAL